MPKINDYGEGDCAGAFGDGFGDADNDEGDGYGQDSGGVLDTQKRCGGGYGDGPYWYGETSEGA